MTIRKPVANTHNMWHNAQNVDVQDMDLEQRYNVDTNAAIIHNHFGSGVLPRSIDPLVVFDSNNLDSTQASLVAAGNFDGTGVSAHAQPTDSNLGNQLAVTLSDSPVFGRLSTKVLIIGLDFQGNTQYDRFTFHKNETQVTAKHYTSILSIFFNDFKGNNNCSANNGGNILITEANSYQLSRDPIMIAQDVEPNLFFRDFKVSDPVKTLAQTIQDGIGPNYTVDSLNINTTVKINRELETNDVTTKIGQKFIAKTNNIQKITLLLGASADGSVPIDNKYDWSGDLVVTVYELQTTVSCPSDIVPELNIEYEPKPQPLAQLSFSQDDLFELGYVLTDTLQPVDFVFNNTQIGSIINSVIVENRYYAVTINRSGDASIGSLITGVGNNTVDNSRLTLFNGVWSDVPEEDLWFQVWTDAAKVADGQAYDLGNGIETSKTEINNLGAEVDYSFGGLEFADSGEGVLNTAIITAVEVGTRVDQDERTGAPVFSQKRFEPSFNFLTPGNLGVLKATAEPLIIGGAKDVNAKLNPKLSKKLSLPGLVKGDTLTIVDPDPDILSLNLIGSKLVPNVLSASNEYRIFKTVLCVDGYGDVNGDGVIDSFDIAAAAALIGADLTSPATQADIAAGLYTTLEVLRADVDGDGVVTVNDVDLITDYVTRKINGFPVGSTFRHFDIVVQASVGRNDNIFTCQSCDPLGCYPFITDNGTIIDPTTLTPSELLYYGFSFPISMDGADATFNAVPFVAVDFDIIFQPFWKDYMLLFSSNAREVFAAFTYNDSLVTHSCDLPGHYECEDRPTDDVDPDPGRNDYLIPGNLIMKKGDIIRPDGTLYPVDYEIAHVILHLPATPLTESLINIMDKFVVDIGDGRTSAGFPAMKFSDCSTVKADALIRDQVRFSVAIQAFYPNLDGYDIDGYGIIVDDIIGVHIDHDTGVLTLSIKDLDVDPIFMTLVTKIEITVHLKRAGWKNNVLVVLPDQIAGILSP